MSAEVSQAVGPSPASPMEIVASPSSRESILALFDTFRATLDDQNDRHERLVKLSRDLTIQSKRIIFLLHRVAATPPPPVTAEAPTEVTGEDPNLAVQPAYGRAAELFAAQQARQKFEGLKPLFAKIAAELEGQESERYNRAISPGLQEFLESLSFTHWLEHGALITYPEVLAFLSPVPISREDYLLGVSDLSGELMRYAIASASSMMIGARKTNVASVCHFVGECSAGWDSLTPYIRGLGKKQQVTKESLKKIEKAAYALAIRGAEFPDAELRGIMLEADISLGQGERRGRKRGRDEDDDGEDGEW